MFKYAKDGVSVLVVLDTRRAKKSGLYPVKVQVIFMRKQKYYSTGKDLSKADWERLADAKDRKLSRIRSEVENSFFLIREQVEKLAGRGEFCFDTLKLRLGRSSGSSINSAFEAKISELAENEQVGSYHSYKYTSRLLEKYAGKDIPFNAVTVEWLRRFERYVLAQGKSYTSLSFYLRNLRHIMNRALRDGIIKRTQFPFGAGKYEIPEGAGRKMALTLPQIRQVVTYTNGSPVLEEFRDLWFFSYLCNGINFADLLFLKYSNIENGEICFIRAKTARSSKFKKTIRAVITPEMQEIMDRWGNPPLSPDTYIFRYATGRENSWERHYKVKNVTKRCNRILKVIANALGLSQLSTYTARHSFATVLKRSGANIAYISESLGHANLATTENYLAGFEREERVRNARLLTRF